MSLGLDVHHLLVDISRLVVTRSLLKSLRHTVHGFQGDVPLCGLGDETSQDLPSSVQRPRVEVAQRLANANQVVAVLGWGWWQGRRPCVGLDVLGKQGGQIGRRELRLGAGIGGHVHVRDDGLRPVIGFARVDAGQRGLVKGRRVLIGLRVRHDRACVPSHRAVSALTQLPHQPQAHAEQHRHENHQPIQQRHRAAPSPVRQVSTAAARRASRLPSASTNKAPATPAP